MKNQDVAKIFREIADILEIKGENPFRIRAYQRAARNIEATSEDIELLVKENRLEEIPGVGSDLADKIKEIVTSGKLKFLEELKKDIPQGLVDMLNIPGIGPKTAKLLHERLGINDVIMLERMAHAGKISNLPGIKEKTVENILRGIELLKRGQGRMDLKTATDVANFFVNQLKNIKELKKIDPAGSLRRMKETVRDIDILVSSTKPEKVMDYFTKLPEVKDVLAKGPTKSSILTKDNIQVDVRVIEDASYGAALMYFTGSKEHNIKLRQLAMKKGLKLNEYGLFRDNKRIAGRTEAEMYKALGLCYIVPELREDRGEIELALEKRLPKLIELSDIKGEFHVHSNWSDGGSSIEEIVERARAMGYEYIAIADHSQGLKIAGGLDRNKLKEKRKEIDRLKKRYNDIAILYGTEVDIDSDGKLDYPDDILREMDVVIAAIHAGFKQSKEKMTNRIVKACQNRYVDIIAHLTGRLWGAREPYELDLEKVFKVCKETGTLLEINSFPQRLDLNDINCRMAKGFGVKFVINTDAHIAEQLGLIKYGISVARRGWLTREDIINTLPLDEVRKNLKRR